MSKIGWRKTVEENWPIQETTWWATPLINIEPEWHWAIPETPLSLPDFIRMSAKGDAKIINGVACIKKDGPDPAAELLADRMEAAQKAMEEAMLKNLYEGTDQVDHITGLASLLKDKE